MKEEPVSSTLSILGGVLITMCTPVLPFLAWPLLIFAGLFPDDCGGDDTEALCLVSDSAIYATLVTELIVYTLLSHFVLSKRLFSLKRTGYIGEL